MIFNVTEPVFHYSNRFQIKILTSYNLVSLLTENEENH